MQAARPRRRRPLIARHRRALALEAAAAAIVGATLLESLQYLDRAAQDLRIAFGIAVFTFSIALFLHLHHVAEVLKLACPRCHEIFHGDGVERISSPFRRRCAHCAAPPSQPRNDAPPQPDA